jgi:hypothetical protein
MRNLSSLSVVFVVICACGFERPTQSSVSDNEPSATQTIPPEVKQADLQLQKDLSLFSALSFKGTYVVKSRIFALTPDDPLTGRSQMTLAKEEEYTGNFQFRSFGNYRYLRTVPLTKGDDAGRLELEHPLTFVQRGSETVVYDKNGKPHSDIVNRKSPVGFALKPDSFLKSHFSKDWPKHYLNNPALVKKYLKNINITRQLIHKSNAADGRSRFNDTVVVQESCDVPWQTLYGPIELKRTLTYDSRQGFRPVKILQQHLDPSAYTVYEIDWAKLPNRSETWFPRKISDRYYNKAEGGKDHLMRQFTLMIDLNTVIVGDDVENLPPFPNGK